MDKAQYRDCDQSLEELLAQEHPCDSWVIPYIGFTDYRKDAQEWRTAN